MRGMMRKQREETEEVRSREKNEVSRPLKKEVEGWFIECCRKMDAMKSANRFLSN